VGRPLPRPSYPLTLYKSLHFPASPLQPWRWRQKVSPKLWHLPTSLHDVRTQNNNIIIILTAVKASNLTLEICLKCSLFKYSCKVMYCNLFDTLWHSVAVPSDETNGWTLRRYVIHALLWNAPKRHGN
jgi:hypothetical protein